ncbi:precorrin-3B synthase [Streptomyces sp. PU-14G]|uniref:precorrin-3B synthase n=1 Tax=Streptomyces sp. PU-14G TaxID=2800808 RepID=UPI0034E0301D
MLAAMVLTPSRSSAPDAATVAAATHCAAPRARGDACPGALRLHHADDGALARVRVPGGVLDSAQAEALAEAALRLGDGDLHLTSRGNLQLRGLSAQSADELGRLLEAARLLPSVTHERVRNIVASPLSGLDGAGGRDVRSWLVELDRLLCASEEASELSGRFLFALDDGRGDVSALGADVTLLALRDGDALLRVGGHEGERGGGAADVLRVPGEHAPLAALAAAEAFCAVVREHGERAWRIGDLPPEGRGLVVRRAAERAGPAARTVPLPPSPAQGAAAPPPEGPAPGLVRAGGGSGAAGDRGVALSVLAPLGRLDGDQWRLLARTARHKGAGELRVTPWRGIVVPGVADEAAEGALAALGAAGLVTDPASPWRGVGACTGRPGCGKALADVRTDAASCLSKATAHTTPTAARPSDASRRDRQGLPVYWSGCARRCGRPRGDHVDVVAEAGGYRVTTVSAHGTQPAPSPLVPYGDYGDAHPELAATVAAARGHTPWTTCPDDPTSDATR